MTQSEELFNSLASEESPAPRRSRGWGKLSLGGLLLVGTLLFFLPTLLGTLCQSPEGLAWITGQPSGRLAIGRASFGWQGPVLLHDVVLNNKAGQTLAQVDSLTSKKSFWDILTKPSGPLQLHLEGLKMTVIVKDSGTLEQKTDIPALSKTLGSAMGSSLIPRPVLAMDLSITSSSVEFRDERDQIIDVWSGLTAEYHSALTPSPVQSFQIRVPANADKGTGEIVVQGDINSAAGANPADTVNVDIKSDRMSLIPAQPFLRKYLGPNQPLQKATGDLKATFSQHPTEGWLAKAALRLADPSQANSAVQLDLDSHYSLKEDLLALNNVQLAAQGAALKLQGQVAQLSTIQQLSLTGEVNTAGSSLLDLLPEELRREIQVQGISITQIQVQGPLNPAPDSGASGLAASMVVGWNLAHAYGLTSNNGQLRVMFQNQQLFSEVIHVPVNGGLLRQLPVIDLSRETPIALFSEGPVLENVALTEEVCRGWMMYTSPTLANATSSEGRFSLSMHPGHFIIGSPEKSEVSGVIAIKDGKVKPGPLAAEILGNVGQLQAVIQKLKIDDITQQTIMEIPDEQLAFILKDGRVYHDNFGVNIRGMRVATSGSVGLDQTLNLQVIMPIPDKWVAGGGPVLMALRGEVIQLMVYGTISQPNVDGRPVAEFAKRFGVKAVGGLIDKLIERRQQRGR